MKRNIVIGLALIVSMTGFFGCAGQELARPDRPRPVYLDTWIDNNGLDRVVEALRSNSFIKGRPFTIAKGKGEAVGESISNQIDLLTEGLRERLVSLCLQYPEIKIVRRHPVSVQDRPYRLQDLRCGGYTEYEAILLIDIIRYGRLDNDLVVINIKAIDLKTGNWVPGLSLAREVALTPEQSRDLNTVHPDEYLQGTKYVPFLPSEGAEMAAYLAKNLSCIFREAASDREIKIFVDASRVKRRNNHIVWFLKKQLQFCNEIQLVNTKEKADWVLMAEAKETGAGSGIGQFWIDAYERKGGELIKGLATYACFVLGPEKQASIIGKWEIVRLPSRAKEGLMEIEARPEGGFTGNLFNIGGTVLRKRGIFITLSGSNIDWSYYDDQKQRSVVTKGLLLENGDRIAVKVTTFPATEGPYEQELALID
ncbi:MAG: hypothetical protein H8E00_00470 [Deltaproteobacteria bacterium]|nr:hypothetical protein [Deltaproteobacteria bacterium]